MTAVGRRSASTVAAGLESLILTPSAIRRLSAIRCGEVPSTTELPVSEETSLRIAVDGGGCSGLQYCFELTDEPPEDEDL